MNGLDLKGAEDGIGYLMRWMGMVGGSVGLEVPFDVARKVMDGRSRVE